MNDAKTGLLPLWNASAGQLKLLKALLFVACLLPLARLGWLALANDGDGLGANPIEFVSRFLGTWTLNFLLLTLCVTPLRKLTGWHWLIRLRRMLGLFVFFYVVLHFLAWVGLDQYFDVDSIVRDIIKRPFISVGFAAFVLLIPLAATSSNAAIRKLGGKRWQNLHYSIYVIAILGVVHYLWLVKRVALLTPIGYAIALAILLGWRARERMRKYQPFKPRPSLPAVATIKFMERPK